MMSNYFQVVATNQSSWIVSNGIEIYDDIADCGHHHKTITAAQRCLSKLVATGATTWHACGEVRDAGGRPVDDSLLEGYGG